MPANVALFLSILAGYTFIHVCYFTRFRAQRLDGYRLVIESALAGLILYFAARIIEPWTPPWTMAIIKNAAGNNSDLIDTVHVLALGLFSPILVNFATAAWVRAISRDNEDAVDAGADGISAAWTWVVEPARRAALNWAVHRLGNDLLSLLHDAANRPSERQMPIHLTLDNNKVYVGWVLRSPSLKLEDEYLSILPLASGYRDKDTLTTHLNVSYPVGDYMSAGGALDPNDFTVVIPYASVKKANYFDVNVYAKYFSAQNPPEPASAS
jgi:hypothetical protein